MQTYENKGAEAFSNGGAGHINGAELSRMREVAFEKNQSEPLVRRPPPTIHTHTQMYFIRPEWFFLTGCPLDLGGDSEAQWQAALLCGQNTARRDDPQTR